MTVFESIIIAIVQGLTEFLPVSSTGHMIITETLMGMEQTSFLKTFTVSIQLGSILSVVVLYWKRFFQSVKFYNKLFIAFIPSAIIGLLFKDFIVGELLGNIWVVAVSLLAGGVVFLFVDKWFRKNEQQEPKELKYSSAFKIGLFQCIAMIPGVSRSAATIIGGLTQKLNRKNAAEFSFFLAVPTMFAATALELWDSARNESFGTEQIQLLAIGNLVAFVVAGLAIKAFIAFLTRFGFKIFGYYRIAAGLLIIILLLLGYDLKIID